MNTINFDIHAKLIDISGKKYHEGVDLYSSIILFIKEKIDKIESFTLDDLIVSSHM